MASEGALAALEKEFRPLLAPKLLAEAKAAQVVWARVKGYPAWPAQVLTEAAALRRKDLGQERHSKGNSIPVMFFGTVEVAWVKDADVVDFKEGLYQGFFDRKTKHFRLALEQVCEYLALDRRRKAPPKWWCKPPSNGLDDQPDGPSPKLVSASGYGAAKGSVQRQDASKGSRQRNAVSGSDVSASCDEDEAPAAQAVGRKGPAKSAGAKDGAAGRLGAGETAAAVPVAKPRDSSNGRLPRDNGSTAASTNTAAQAQARRPPAAPPAAPGREQGLKASTPAGDAAKDARETHHGAPAAIPGAKALPTSEASQLQQQQQQRLRSSGGASSAPAKEHDTNLPPRKRLKVETARGPVMGPTAASSSLPPRPVVAKRTTSVGEGVSALGAAGISEVDVLKLPAEIRRLAGIRLPALPKKPGFKVEDSPREHPLPKAGQAAASTAANGPIAALKPASAAGEGAGMELRSGRSRRSSSAARTGQSDGGRSSGSGQRKRSRDRSSSGEESQSAASSDDGDEEEEVQSSREDADSDAAASSSDEDSDASEEASEEDTVVEAARRGGRASTAAQSHGRATRAKSQLQLPPARDRKGEKQRRLARLAAPEPANRRTSSRLMRKGEAPAPSKKTMSEDLDTADSTSASEGASDGVSEESGEGEDERRSPATTSSGSESDSEDEPVEKESGSSEGGIRLRSHTRALQATHARPQRAARKGSAGPSTQPPSREANQPAARDSVGRVDKAVDAAAGDKRPQRRDGSGAVSAPLTRGIPLELRRLQSSPSARPPVVDTREPRTLRDRSSPARRTVVSTGASPTVTATAGTSAGGKHGEERVSEDGSGASMSPAVERSRSPEHRRDGQKVSSAVEVPRKPVCSQTLERRSSKGGSVAGSASPPPAPVPGGMPVRKKPPSLGVPSAARSDGQARARQLPAITPARAILRSSASMSDALPSNSLPASDCAGTGTPAAGALLAPVAVCVLKKPSTGPPTRRLVEPGLEAPISSTDLPDIASLDGGADAKRASSPDVAATDAMAAGDGHLPRSPDAVSVDGSGIRKLGNGLAAGQLAVPVDEQQPLSLQLQQVLAEHHDGHGAELFTPTSGELRSVAGAQQGYGDAAVPGAEEGFVEQRPKQTSEQCEAPEGPVLCSRATLEPEPGLGLMAELQDQVDRQPRFCCQQALVTTLTEPMEQVAALTSRSSVVHDQETELAQPSPARALSAPAQPQWATAEQAASALGPLERSSPGSPIHEEVLLSEEQFPDQGEAMAEHDGVVLPQDERLELGSSGGSRDPACVVKVAVAESEAARELPIMPSPAHAAPDPPLNCNVASLRGAVSAPLACAGSRASSEAGCSAGAPPGVSGASCSAALWGEDDDVAARARARELEELGEVAAALAGLQQAEVPRLPLTRSASQPPAGQLPAVLHVDSLLLERSRSRGSRVLPCSAAVRDQPTAQGSSSLDVFRWPQPEPLLPSHDQSFALPRDWLVTRPPRYEPVKRNVWLSRNKPKRLPKDEINICACRAPPFAAPGELQRMGCGESCLNRLSSILCDAKLCPCGELCSNRSLHLLRQPKTEVFLTENRGWGVRTMEPLSKGAFIIEYAGEAIDERELGRRMEHARMNGEPHFYIMELSAGLYIDARRKGNIARLINSSCDPNCETQKWHDASTGEVRVGIFASRDIAPGEELVYDYFFSTYGALKPSAASFVCMCGSKNCRGTMDLHPEKRRDLGRRVEVFWDADEQFYRAVIVAYHPTSKKHTVMYEDGGTEKLSLDEVPHRWMDDDHPRTSPHKRNALHDEAGAAAQALAGAAVQTTGPEPQQQRLQAVSAVHGDVADVLPGARCVPIAAVPSQAPPRPLVPIDQRCLLPPLGGSSVDVVTTQSHGQLGRQGPFDSELHLPLKKRQRMMQQLSLPAQQQQPSSQPSPLGASSRAGEAVPDAANPQVSGGSADCVAAPASGFNRHSGGGVDSAGGEPNGLSCRTSLRHESSTTASGRISSVAAAEDDPNEDLDSLLEAAEAVAALRTAPICNPAALHAPQDAMLPLQPRHVRSGSVAAAGLGAMAMVQTAKVASPRHLATVQRAGPPSGLPPHGGSRPSGTAAAHPSSSSSGFIPYQAGGSRQHPTSYGSGHRSHGAQDGGPGGPCEHQHQSHGRNGLRFSVEHEGSAGPSGSRGRNGSGYGNGYASHTQGDTDREDLLWKLVGIEKPKDLLPLFSGECEKLRNADVKSRAGSGNWIAPSHPYGKLLRALEASELLPHAEQLGLFARQYSMQQQQQRAQQHQQQVQAQQPLLALQAKPSAPHLLQQQQQQPASATSGSATSAEALALSTWHQLAQQHVQQQQHYTNGNSFAAFGMDNGTVAALLHHAHQQQVAAAAAAAAVAATSGQLHHLHALQSHGAHTLTTAASATAGPGTAGLPGRFAGQQPFAAAAAAAAASHWQQPVHAQPGSIIQDLVQMYVAQHAAGSHPMMAVAGTTTVGGPRV